eukprot:scaffold149_cov315-Pinguiococcus_pyrenoidosus.AAC.110
MLSPAVSPMRKATSKLSDACAGDQRSGLWEGQRDLIDADFGGDRGSIRSGENAVDVACGTRGRDG